VRNNDFDARNYLSTTVPPFHRNEFGSRRSDHPKHVVFRGEYAGLWQTLREPNLILVPTFDERNRLVILNGYQYQVPMNSVAQQILSKCPMLDRGSSPT
jgi:hypothetical protein